MDMLIEKPLNNQRLSPKEGLKILKEASWTQVVGAAHAFRNQKNPHQEVSYTCFRVVNYTNYCTIECKFCSFMDEVNSDKGYTLNLENIFQKMDEAVKIGANQMFFQGGVNPDLPLNYYTDILKAVKERYAGIHIRGFSPVEVYHMSRFFDLPLEKLLQQLKEAGLDSIPGAGAEILGEKMRQKLSPKKLSAEDWSATMQTAHEAGLKGSANIVFGSDESPEEIIEHLEIIRSLQDKSGGFHTFIPWTFQPQTKKFFVRRVPHDEYLKTLGLCRLYLDNIQHIEVSLMVLGKDIGQLALKCGADDISSIVIEENVLRSSGVKSEEAAQVFIRRAGFNPVKRDLNYNRMPLPHFERVASLV
jgi:cyclic dehypoxanthinyl futalosine synthase